MNKFGFVILHYQTVDETLKCIESIRKMINNVKHEIIVVDNGSPNHSGQFIREKYLSEKNISVIISDSNEGFARGNNMGFAYARDVLHCNFIILLNNDTEIVQRNFTNIIEHEYETSRCAVIGPEILKNGSETLDNPGRKEPFQETKLRLFIAMNQMLLFLSYLHADLLPNRVFETYVSRSKKKGMTYARERQEDVALHGCCLVFTPEFIINERGLDPRTFMYMEEDILYEKMHRKRMKMVYLPELKIEHHEAVATKETFQRNYKKRRFIYRNTIQSARILQICKNENLS